MLKEHRKNLSILDILNIQKERIKRELKKIPDSVRYTNNTSLLKFEPPTNKISRMVEKAGIKSAEIHKDLQTSLNVIEQRIEVIEEDIKIVEALLRSLDDQEQFIIRKLFLCGLQVYHLSGEYQKEFNQYMSGQTLRRKKRSALAKMKELILIQN